MPDTPRLTILADNADAVQDALKRLAGYRVRVGIPSDDERTTGAGKTVRTDGKMTNAVLGYLFENGSPATNMPARPWLNPAVRASRDKWLAFLRQAGERALDGDKSGMDKAFHAAGLTAVAAIKAYIATNIPPPLRPATIAARFRRRGMKVPPDAQVTALIDTGQFINSINYSVKKPR